MSQLRKVPSSGFPFGVFEDPLNVLMVTDVNTMENTFYNIIDDKRWALLAFKESPFDYRLSFAWVGKAATHVFGIVEADLEKLLNY